MIVAWVELHADPHHYQHHDGESGPGQREAAQLVTQRPGEFIQVLRDQHANVAGIERGRAVHQRHYGRFSFGRLLLSGSGFMRSFGRRGAMPQAVDVALGRVAAPKRVGLPAFGLLGAIAKRVLD